MGRVRVAKKPPALEAWCLPCKAMRRIAEVRGAGRVWAFECGHARERGRLEVARTRRGNLAP